MLQAGRSRSCAEGEELIADREGVQPRQEKLPVPQQTAHPIKTSNRKQIWLLLTMCKLRVTPQQPVQFPRSCPGTVCRVCAVPGAGLLVQLLLRQGGDAAN